MAYFPENSKWRVNCSIKKSNNMSWSPAHNLQFCLGPKKKKGTEIQVDSS